MRADATAFWNLMARPGPQSVEIGGVTVRRGSRVRLRPHAGGDVFDVALTGRSAVVEGIDEDESGGAHLCVTVEDDPGRDRGTDRQIGHRFFFRPDEVEPMAPRMRVLVAGIGNVFLGDDGFGVEVAKRLAGRAVPPGVTVRDFGIRGMDLAYSLRDYDAAVLIDAAPRGRAPGTLYVIDGILDAEGPPVLETHGMDPLWVLRLARELGPLPKRLLVVGCEPSVIPAPDSDEIVGRLSPPVTAAVDVAVAQVEALLHEILTSATRG